MSLTLLNSPDQVGLSKNPLVYGLQTNNQYSTSGVLATHSWEFSSLPVDGNQATLSWFSGAVSLGFTFTGSPDDTGLQLPLGSGTVNAYLNNTLVPFLELNYYIKRDFDLSVSGDSIVFTARAASADYDISFSSGVGAFSFLKTQAGVSPVERPGFRVLLKMFSRYRGAASWNEVEFEKAPYESKVYFYLDEYLRSYDELVLPDLSTPNALVSANSQMVEYKVDYAENFGSPSQVQKLISQSELFSILGGFNHRDREVNSFYDDWLPKLMTWGFLRTISASTPGYLAFLNTTIYTSFWLVVKLYDAEGLIDERNALSFTANANDLKLVPTSYGFAINGVDLQGRTPSYFEIQIQRSGTTQVIGQKITRNLDWQGAYEDFTVAFRNSFGTIDFFRFKGVAEYRSTTSRTVSDPAYAFNEPFLSRRSLITAIKAKDSLILRTGFMNKDEALMFKDFLLSDRFYLVVGTDYIPVAISGTSNLEQYRSKQYATYGHEVEFSFITEENFSDVENRII